MKTDFLLLFVLSLFYACSNPKKTDSNATKLTIQDKKKSGCSSNSSSSKRGGLGLADPICVKPQDLKGELSFTSYQVAGHSVPQLTGKTSEGVTVVRCKLSSGKSFAVADLPADITDLAEGANLITCAPCRDNHVNCAMPSSTTGFEDGVYQHCGAPVKLSALSSLNLTESTQNGLGLAETNTSSMHRNLCAVLTRSSLPYSKEAFDLILMTSMVEDRGISELLADKSKRAKELSETFLAATADASKKPDAPQDLIKAREMATSVVNPALTPAELAQDLYNIDDYIASAKEAVEKGAQTSAGLGLADTSDCAATSSTTAAAPTIPDKLTSFSDDTGSGGAAAPAADTGAKESGAATTTATGGGSGESGSTKASDEAASIAEVAGDEISKLEDPKPSSSLGAQILGVGLVIAGVGVIAWSARSLVTVGDAKKYGELEKEYQKIFAETKALDAKGLATDEHIKKVTTYNEKVNKSSRFKGNALLFEMEKDAKGEVKGIKALTGEAAKFGEISKFPKIGAKTILGVIAGAGILFFGYKTLTLDESTAVPQAPRNPLILAYLNQLEILQKAIARFIHRSVDIGIAKSSCALDPNALGDVCKEELTNLAKPYRASCAK